MDDKKRKRSESETAAPSQSNVMKKGKYDHLFTSQASNLDAQARSSYIASKEARAVLAAIARGDISAIDSGHAPPGLSKRQRKHWRDHQRRLARQNTKSSQHVNIPRDPIQSKTVAPPSDTSGPSSGGSKKRKRMESVVSMSRDGIIGHFFAGTASDLDSSAQAAYVCSQPAQIVIKAITRGDADAITKVHAPPQLGKTQRKKWREEMRAVAQLSRNPKVQKTGGSTAGKKNSDQASSVDESKQSALAEAQSVSTGKATNDDASLASKSSPRPAAETKKAALPSSSRSMGFTQLMRPPPKVWHETRKSSNSSDGHSTSRKSEDQTSNQQTAGGAATRLGRDFDAFQASNTGQTQPLNSTVRVSSTVSWAPVPSSQSVQAKERVPSVSAQRRSSNASSSMLQRTRSREAVSNKVPRRLPGNRNFDIPDYFSSGTLEDAQRKFEAWARIQRGGQSDSSDSESDDESDDESEVSEKPMVRGSFHESWAEQINAKATERSPKPEVDEQALESSDSEDDDADVQSQVSKELEEATTAALDETTADAEESPAPEEPISAGVVEDSQQDEIFSKATTHAVESDDQTAEQPVEHSSPEEPKVRPSSPQSRPSGTTYYGHPNTTHQANVRVKRTLSQTDPGGDHSGHGQDKPTSKETIAPNGQFGTGTFNDRLDNGELTDDVYEAIDDVTRGLLGTITSVPTKERIPSMNECKPPTDSHNGQDVDQLMTNDASARKTSNLDERADLMEGVGGDAVASDHKHMDSRDDEKGMSLRSENRDDKHVETMETQEQNRRSSPSSSLSGLSHTPSPPQVHLPLHFPETPDNVSEDGGQKKTRKMTGRSSKHFSVAKRPTTRRKPAQPEESIAVSTPDVSNPPAQDQSSSVYETAVSRRTRSAFKESSQLATSEAKPGLDDGTATPRQLRSRPTSSHAAVFSPLSSLEQALNSRFPATPLQKDSKARTAEADEADQPVEDTDPHAKQENLEPSSPTKFFTPEETLPNPQTPQPPTSTPKPTGSKTPKSKPKSTGAVSKHFITDRVDLYNTTASGKRVPAGTSVVPVPPTSAPHFGIIQEKLWREPFWLLIAVTFLNKTAGRSAVPIFWKLKEKYPTPEDLAEADVETLLEMVHSLGLQNQRSKRLVKIAQAWVDEPPAVGRRFRTLNYPSLGDGKAKDVPNVVEEDAELCAGALEIGHIPGCGDYAWDSWRVFCRDVLRGVADDYNGLNAKVGAGEEDGGTFEPEWKRVLPKDKELRACLRWMWLREGWIWDPLTGDKREATEEEMEKAEKGEMEIADPQERKFAVQAAGLEDVVHETPTKSQSQQPAEEAKDDEVLSAELEAQVATAEDDSDTIVLKPRPRRPSRAARIEPSVEVADPPPKPAGSKTQNHGGSNRKRKSEPAPESTSKRKTRTSQFQADDDEDFEVGESTKRRKSKRLSLG